MFIARRSIDLGAATRSVVAASVVLLTVSCDGARDLEPPRDGPDRDAAVQAVQVMQGPPGAEATRARSTEAPAHPDAGLVVAVDVDEERRRFERALAGGDLVTAAASIDALARGLPASESSALELARMRTRIGGFSEALWGLEVARDAYPESVEIAIGIAETALQVRDGHRARAAAESVPEDSPRRAYAELLRARGALEVGDLEQALALLDRAVERHPDHVPLAVARIELLIAEGRAAPARAAVASLRARGGVARETLLWLDATEATLQVRDGDVDGALALLAAATERAADNARAWQLRAELLLARGDAELARDVVEAALEGAPENATLLSLQAKILARLGDRAGAERALAEVRARAEGLESRVNAANALHRAGRTQEAIDLLRDPGASVDAVGRVEAELLAIAFLLDRDRIEEASAALERVAAAPGTEPERALLHARIELGRGEPESAARRLRWVVSQLDRPDVHFWLGMALELSGDLEGAEYRYGLSTARAPGQPAGYEGLIRVYERRGDGRRAAEAAARLIGATPADPRGYESMARALVAIGELDRADALLQAFVERFPESPGAVAGLASVWRAQGRLDEALALLDGLPPEASGAPVVASERAMLLVQKGRAAEAGAALDAVAADAAEAPSVLHARLLILLEAGDTKAAHALAERAVARSPADATPWRMLADAASLRGDWAAAVSSYRAALEIDPARPDIVEHLGDALLRLGRRDDAIAAYRRVVALDEAAVRARNNLAHLLHEAGSEGEALVEAQMAFARAPHEPAVMDTLGWLYLAHDRPERAAALLAAAYARAPDVPEIGLHLAVAHARAGAPDRAAAVLDTLEEQVGANEPLRMAVERTRAGLVQ